MANAPMTTRIDRLPLDEFIRLYDEEGPFELIEGEIVPKMPQVFGHAKISKRLFLMLLPFEQQGIGEVFTEVTFVLTDNQQRVTGSRIPDVMFVLKATMAHFRETIPDAETKPAILIPEFVIEVVSSNDALSDHLSKAERYLADGVQLVWIIDPQAKQVIVRTAGASIGQLITGDAELTGAPVLPTFILNLHELFA